REQHPPPGQNSRASIASSRLKPAISAVLYQVRTPRSAGFFGPCPAALPPPAGSTKALCPLLRPKPSDRSPAMQEPIPAQPVSRTGAASIKTQFAPRRILMNAAMVMYCLALFFVFDFLYSSFTAGQEHERTARVYDPVYDHGFAPDFDGYDVW